MRISSQRPASYFVPDRVQGNSLRYGLNLASKLSDGLKFASTQPVIASNGYFAKREVFDANFERVLQAVNDYWVREMKNTGKRLPVLLGMDDTPDAKRLHEKAVNFFKKQGLDVYTYQSRKYGLLPLPIGVLAHTVKHFKELNQRDKAVCGGLMISNGSRSMEINGLRFINPNGAFFTHAQIRQLNHLVKQPQNLSMSNQKGEEKPLYYFQPAYPCHLKKVLNLNKLKTWIPSIFYSPMQGAAKDMFDTALEPWVKKFTTVQDGYDKSFTIERFTEGRNLRDKNLKSLKNEIFQWQAGSKIGLANNGDAGTIRVLDEEGAVIPPAFLASLLLQHQVENKKAYGIIVKTQDTSALIDEVARFYGLKVYEVPVGFQHVSQFIQQNKDATLLGLDSQGGLTSLGQSPVNDGLFSNFRVLEMLSYWKEKPIKLLKKMLDKLPVVIHSSQFKIKSNHPEKIMEFFKSLATSYRPIGYFRIDIRRSQKQLEDAKRHYGINGSEVKIFFKDDSWLLARRRSSNPFIIDLWVETLKDKRQISWKTRDLGLNRHNNLIERLEERMRQRIGAHLFEQESVNPN